jgi:hypothetical protein
MDQNILENGIMGNNQDRVLFMILKEMREKVNGKMEK